MTEVRQPVRIGTRGSELALWQAHLVADHVRALGLEVELVLIKTSGDLDTTRPLAELGQATGEVGLFTKEIQRALLRGEVDLAVHSLKDLPTDPTPGLTLLARPVRAPVSDLLLCHPGAVDEADPVVPLARGATVGTSSVRRRVQLLALRPDLELVSIRGNVPTRVDKARTREVDAVVLAMAGIDRLALDLAGVRRVELPPAWFVCAPGQGALGIEAR
ncbi:MAG: hydroxymethylbilane synthase, partial [Planctomycetota bacterium]|nr:hydroxymethylbilane synthase [Planctomycetota bacterium]